MSNSNNNTTGALIAASAVGIAAVFASFFYK